MFYVNGFISEDFSVDVFIHVEIQSASSLQTPRVKTDLFRLDRDYTGVVGAGGEVAGCSR